jgi:hypothetical protein
VEPQKKNRQVGAYCSQHNGWSTPKDFNCNPFSIVTEASIKTKFIGTKKKKFEVEKKLSDRYVGSVNRINGTKVGFYADITYFCERSVKPQWQSKLIGCNLIAELN